MDCQLPRLPTNKSSPTIVHAGTVQKPLSRVSSSKSNRLKLIAITLSTLHNKPVLVQFGNRLVIHVAMLSPFYSIKKRIHSVTSSHPLPLWPTRRFMSKHFCPSTLPMSMEMLFTLHPPLYQTTRIQNLKMIQSYLPPLVIPLEGQGSAESVVSTMKLIVKNVCSGVRGVVRLGTHVGLVVKQLMGQLNCF